MTTVKRIQETDLPMLAKDRLDLSLNYVCKELERFQTDLNASLESELSSMKKTEANQILDAMRKPNHLCEPSYGVEP